MKLQIVEELMAVITKKQAHALLKVFEDVIGNDAN